MRITNNMLTNNFLSGMNKNLENMKTVQQQMTSGKLYQKPSDNPSAVTRSMQLNTSLNSISQYNSNISDASNFLDTTDTALGQADNVIQRIRELMVSAGNAAYGSPERTSIKDEINQNISQFAQILNTNFDGKYIFGGTRADVKPVDAVNNSSILEKDISCNQSDSPNASVSGHFTGSSDTAITVKVTAASGTNLQTVKVQLGTGEFGADIKIDSSKNGTNTFNIGNGLTIDIKDTTKDTDTYTINCTSTGNEKLVYCDKSGGELNTSSTVATDTQQFGMLKSKMKTEISQGVTVDYNVTATDIMGGTNTDGSYDLRQIFSNIVNHLDGKVDDGNGNLSVDATTATSDITNSDLAAIDTAMNNLLKMRSQVGAKSNRMTSALDQNTQQNLSMTEILSKTADVDITKATMQFATLQTVYLASLQTSAKVIQPSLMDYLK